MPQNNREYLPIGYKIGYHYEIIKVLGQGGFGIIYLVKDHERLGEIFVIKELFAKSFSSRDRNGKSVNNKIDSNNVFKKIKEDILEEVNILKKINNKNIVKAYGCLEENNTIYSIMEFIEGEDLEQYNKKNPFNENEAKELLKQLINGLKEIHPQNIIHRDIKPNNIIKMPNGIYKIIDFTTNRSYQDGKMTTMTGFQNPIYTPPELIQKKAVIGNYTDIYSIGMTLVSLLVKYKNNLPNLTDRLVNDSEFQYVIKRLNISEKFRDALVRMTEIKSEKRFQSIEEIENILFKKKKKDIPIVTELGLEEEINLKSKDLKKGNYRDTVSQKNTSKKINKQSSSWFKKMFIPLLFLTILAYGGYKNKEYISNLFNDSITYLKLVGSKEFSQGNVQKFIKDFTLAEETNWAEKTLPYFSNRLNDYYGSKNISKKKIHKNKILLNSKYSNHEYKLLSLEIVEKGVEYCKLIRRVRYKSSLTTSKVLSGVAIDAITLEKYSNTFQITSIYRISTQKDIPKEIESTIVNKEFNRENIEFFLKEFVASGENDSPEKLLKFYASKVNRYFRWTNTTRDKIYEDKHNFFKKWTFRRYELIDFTVIDKYAKDGIDYCTLSNKIKWRAKSSSKSNSGISNNFIKLKSENGSFKVISIYNLSNDIDSIPIIKPNPITTLELNYENTKKFLKNFLKTKEGNSAEDIAQYFSYIVDNYYGTYNLVNDNIIQKKKNWISMWESREFRLVNLKILRTYFKDGVEYCDLERTVDWKHKKVDSSKYMSGTSRKAITIKKSGNSFKITSIYRIKEKSMAKKINRNNIKKFLNDFLRTKERNSAEDIAHYFSFIVENYYGTSNKSKNDITENKKNWINMWKSRQFTLVNFEILKTYSEDGIEYYDLKENVDWQHSKNYSTIERGNSSILMTLKVGNSDFKIVSITNSN